MAITTTEFNSILDRVIALEDRINDLTTTIFRLVTIDQVTQLGLLRQTEIAEHDVRLTGVESRLSQLESYHRT